MGETRLVIGMPLYDAGEHLEEALSSILCQTYRELAVVMTDDRPTGEVEQLIERLGDPRVSYTANPQRLGLIGNWQRAFQVVRERYPEAQYFAWASDHDAWHPLWAERLIRALEDNPDAAMTYPQTFRMTMEGQTLKTNQARRPAQHEPDPARRLRLAVHGMSAGNMVYGIFRVDPLERAGVLRRVLLPDRLLLTELSLAGDLLQVDERLFYRRVTQQPTIARQRAAFWPEGPPRYASLPWTVQHIGLLTALLLRRRAGPADAPFSTRCGYATTHATAVMAYASRRVVVRAYGRAARIARRSIRTVHKRSMALLVGAVTRARGGQGDPSSPT